MTPAEKAQEISNKTGVYGCYKLSEKEHKKIDLFVVNQIIDSEPHLPLFWNEVKAELEKM